MYHRNLIHWKIEVKCFDLIKKKKRDKKNNNG